MAIGVNLDIYATNIQRAVITDSAIFHKLTVNGQ
jgi:hypothetical protein